MRTTSTTSTVPTTIDPSREGLAEGERVSRNLGRLTEDIGEVGFSFVCSYCQWGVKQIIEYVKTQAANEEQAQEFAKQLCNYIPQALFPCNDVIKELVHLVYTTVDQAPCPICTMAELCFPTDCVIQTAATEHVGALQLSLNTTLVHYRTARKTCRKSGYRMVEIWSEMEFEEISRWVSERAKQETLDFWLAIKKKAGGQYVWKSGQPLDEDIKNKWGEVAPAASKSCAKYQYPSRKIFEANCATERYATLCQRRKRVACPMLTVLGANSSNVNGEYDFRPDMMVGWAPTKPVFKHQSMDRYIFFLKGGYGWSIGNREGLKTGGHFIKSGLTTEEPWYLPWSMGIRVECRAGRDCIIEKSIDYYGNDVNDGRENKQPSFFSCKSSCADLGVKFFTYNDHHHEDPANKQACWCKHSNIGSKPCMRCTSGTALCGPPKAPLPLALQGKHALVLWMGEKCRGKMSMGETNECLVEVMRDVIKLVPAPSLPQVSHNIVSPHNPRYLTVNEIFATAPGNVQRKEYVELSLMSGNEAKSVALQGYKLLLIKGTTLDIGATIELIVDLWNSNTNAQGFWTLGGEEVEEADMKITDWAVQSRKKILNLGTDDFLPDGNDIIWGIALVYFPGRRTTPPLELTESDPVLKLHENIALASLIRDHLVDLVVYGQKACTDR